MKLYGSLDLQTQSSLRLFASSGANYMALRAPSSVTAAKTLTLPDGVGSANYALTTDGSSGVLSWSKVVAGAASSTDTALMRWSGTGGNTAQNSGVLLDGSNNMSGIVALTATGNLTIDTPTLFVDSSAHRVGVGTLSPARKLHVSISDASNNAVTEAARITHATSGSPAAGIGVGMEFETQATAGNKIGSIIDSVSTNVGSGTEAFDLVLRVMAGGAAAAEQARLKSSGELLLKTALQLEDPGAGVNKITIQAPTLSGDLSLTLPSSAGTSGYVLSTNGSGVLSWVSNAALNSFKTDWITADGTTKTVTHSLSSTDVIVQVFDEANGNTIHVDIASRTDANTVTLTASEAPNASNWRVLILAI